MNLTSEKQAGRLNYVFKTLLFAGTIILIALLFPKDFKFKYNFTLGKPWMYDDLFAPFGFSINKPQNEIDQEVNKIIKSTPPYFIVDQTIDKSNRNEIISRFQSNAEFRSEHDRQRHMKICLLIFDSIYNKGIIGYNDVLKNKSQDYTIYVIRNNIAEEKMANNFYSLRQAYEYTEYKLGEYKNINKEILDKILNEALTPNIIYSFEYTYKQQLTAIRKISTTRGYLQKNQKIVYKGELVNSEKYEILQSLRKQYEESKGTNFNYYIILSGQLILITLAIIMLVFFLIKFRADIIADNKKTSLILSIILFMSLGAGVMIRFYGYEYIYVLPLCIVPLMIRTFFDTRLALFVHLVSIIIIGFLAPNGFEFIFLQLVAGIVTIISIVRLEKRSQFFITSLYIFGTYSLIYTGMTMMQSGGFNEFMPENLLHFAVNSVLTLLAYPLIVIYEKIFGHVTNVSLLEYSNPNNKLLRELSLKAPGTFQHSLQVANLAEEAAHRINANALLVRAGAMFHDIGKIEKPLYFIENQLYDINPHSALSIKESAEIITGHVEKGVELARKFNIPQQIIDFIRTHHGNRRTEYFYSLYKKQQNVVLPEEIFYYKGPTPFSKETSILMMADSVEAATRCLKKPEKKKIDELVDNIIDGLIEQKQFKNANITMRDISRIKTVLKNKLVSMHHVRIEYPN